MFDEEFRHAPGVIRAVILLFSGERIALQPFEQLLAVSTDHFGLRIVDMGIDKARHDQLIAIIIYFQTGSLPRLRQLPLAFPPVAQPDDMPPLSSISPSSI